MMKFPTEWKWKVTMHSGSLSHQAVTQNWAANGRTNFEA